MPILVIATRNRHKVQEIKSILGPGFEYLSLLDLEGAPEPVEDAETFAGNALKKAASLAEWLQGRDGFRGQPREIVENRQFPAPARFVLADDSGLEVDALGGAPGVHSARFAALDRTANSTDAANCAKLLRLLDGIPDDRRTARFRCAVALAGVFPGELKETESPRIFEGTCEGRILTAPRGSHGFGYDPLFVPEGFSETFAELGEEIKNGLSHRGQALKKLANEKLPGEHSTAQTVIDIDKI